MPKPSVLPAPHTAIGIATLDYNNHVNKKAFQRALDTNFDAEIRAILARPRGEVRLADGSTFRIAYVNAKGASRLVMTRQLPESASRLDRVFHAVLDNLGEIGKIRRKIEDVAHKSQALARQLEAHVPAIVDGLWNQELSLQLQAENDRFDSHQVDAWLCSPRRSGMFQQQCVAAIDRHDGRQGERTLTVTFALGKHTQRVEFRTARAETREQGERASRDLYRMERVIRGQYAERFGNYRSAREMMAIFKTVTVIEETRLELQKRAHALVPQPHDIAGGHPVAGPEGNLPAKAFYLSVATESAALASDTARTIDLALLLCSGTILTQARDVALRFTQPAAQSSHDIASRDLLEYHTAETFAVAERAISALLRDHRASAFRDRFKLDIGASIKDIELLETHAAELGNSKGWREENLGDRHASTKPNDGAPPGTQIVLFNRKLSPSEVALRLLTFDASSVRSDRMPVSSIGVAAAREGNVPRMLYRLCINKFPACLRFDLASATADMPGLLTRLHYRSLDQLADDLYQTVHDDRMHRIAAEVREKIDGQVQRMRADMRANLRSGLVAEAHADEFLRGLPNGLPQAELALRRTAFEQGRACLKQAGGSIDAEQRERLLRSYDRGLQGQAADREDLAIGVQARLAHEAGRRDGASVRQGPGAQADAGWRQSMTFALHDAFEAGLLPPSFAEAGRLHLPCADVVGKPASALRLAEALVAFMHARHDWAAAHVQAQEARRHLEAWRYLADSGGLHADSGRAKAFEAAHVGEARANHRQIQCRANMMAMRDVILNLCMDAGMSRNEADYVMAALDQGQRADLVRPTQHVSLPPGELDRRLDAMREAAQRASDMALRMDTLVDERERELRARTDLMVVGRSTLGEFDRWHRGEMRHAADLRPRPAVPDAAEQPPAIAGEPVPPGADPGAISGAIAQPRAEVGQAERGAAHTVSRAPGRTVSDSAMGSRPRAAVARLDDGPTAQSRARRHTDSDVDPRVDRRIDSLVDSPSK
ncbi:hypothetical protein J5T34_00755 [Cupriavidus gilardii]|uniref:hypothetical protein n=1 Tax=Cupriavidus gilardii TaxID=82541 RepID=UPI001ABE66EA|nr:hypothetical protein [Cupriavidus gilardii]MBO4119262.1 hypothetical protein [Cupriavidus gilardii]